jgi:hypothetical protein
MGVRIVIGPGWRTGFLLETEGVWGLLVLVAEDLEDLRRAHVVEACLVSRWRSGGLRTWS